MSTEGYKGLGKKSRRIMIRLWKASGCKKPLKIWAKESEVGDIARAWFEHKRTI